MHDSDPSGTAGGEDPSEGPRAALTRTEILDRLIERYGDKIDVVRPPIGARRSAGDEPATEAAPEEGEQEADQGSAAEVEPARSRTERQTYGVVDREHVLPILEFLRHDAELSFEMLSDVTAVDHLHLEMPEIGERFAVVYQLFSWTRQHRFTLKARVPESDPRLPSAYGLWKSALWAEREVYDMFGIEFDGNPDMRRLLMPEDFPGFPLRKDYPLRGEGERDAFPQMRTVSVPVESSAAEQPREKGGDA